MPKFTYQAKAPNGQVQSGQMDAVDESEVRIRLRSKNLVPLRVIGGGGISSAAQKSNLISKKNVTSRELQIFTRQFSTLINAGIPIVDSLKMLGEGRRNPTLLEVANKVRLGIEGGKRLGDSMSGFPKVFDRFYVNMVRAGEEAGILDEILARLTVYMEKAEKLKKQVKGAMVYPMAILFVSFVVVTGILVFIIPKFQDLFKSSGKELPGLTQMVVGISQFFIHKWYLVIAGAVAIPYGIIQYINTPQGKDEFDRIIIRTPLFGDLVQKSSIAKMSRTLATLLTAGVSVLEAIEIAARTSGNRVIEESLLRAKDAITSGKALATPLAKEKLIPEMVVQMIAIGEKSGTMEIMFGKIADFYEDDVENAVKAMTTLIEPVLMMFLGVIIAILVLAMYLPIFSLASLGG